MGLHNVKSIRSVGQNEWEIQTPRDAGRLIPHYDRASGILDHEFVDPKEGSREVSARIVSAGAKDCVHMITLVKPPSMPEEAFRQGMPLVEEELQMMRRILDRQERSRENAGVSAGGADPQVGQEQESGRSRSGFSDLGRQ